MFFSSSEDKINSPFILCGISFKKQTLIFKKKFKLKLLLLLTVRLFYVE